MVFAFAQCQNVRNATCVLLPLLLLYLCIPDTRTCTWRVSCSTRLSHSSSFRHSDWSISSTTVGYGPIHYKVPRTARGGLCVHRPRDDWDGLFVAKRHKQTAATRFNRKRARPEEEEHVLEYLELRHRGNVETAQLSLLVASFAGRGKLQCDMKTQ